MQNPRAGETPGEGWGPDQTKPEAHIRLCFLFMEPINLLYSSARSS